LPPTATTSKTGNTFTVEAILVAGPRGVIRLVIGDISADLDAAGLVDIEELDAPQTLRLNRGRAVRVVLEAGTRILRLGDSRSLAAELFETREPFAYASRPERDFTNGTSFLDRQAAFLAERGIEV